MLPKVSPMTEETKAKIREMSQADVPIGERRALYNQLGRRMKHSGLKPGLVQKYTACLGNSKERFQLLKEFLIDENLLDTEVIYMDVWFHTDTNGGKVIYGWFILIIFSESKVWGRGGGLLCQVKPLFLILQCRYLGPAK